MIELEHVVQSYSGPQGKVQALRGIDLTVSRGEIFGVIGRSGAGKSSLVRTINLLNRPTSGRVVVDGQDMGALTPGALRQARRKIGMIFQHFNLLTSRTVFENVALPLELEGVRQGLIRERVEELLDLVGLFAMRDRYPAQISGGQKQRVGIARALASRPKVLLSDEATSALDPETNRSILALLQQINREFGLTVVLITHQMQVIKQIAERVAVIDAGQIVEQGRVIDVFTRPVHETTRSLIEEILPQTLPDAVIKRIRRLMQGRNDQGALLRLGFAGQEAELPLLSDVIRRFGVDLNIVHGQVDEIQGQTFGSLAVHVKGAAHSLSAAVSHLRQSGVLVQEVAHA
jgi:D-methionine transport system ATP-binding protein